MANSTLIVIRGYSMWPFLKSGQKILVKKTIGPDFRAGDLILYRVDGQFICHRLVKKENRNGNWLFYCRGDASCDKEAINERVVEGKVAALISGQKVINLETPWQRLRAIVILILLAPILAFLVKVYQAVKRPLAPSKTPPDPLFDKEGARGSSRGNKGSSGNSK